MPNVWLTGDTHLNHFNIIRYTNRPFTTVHEMNETIIANWNHLVQPNDMVYHLGDFAFYKKGDYRKILERLNGKITLIIGNHDKGPILKDPRFLSVSPLLHITVDNYPVVLCHYAMRTWHKSHWGSYQFYGHSHGNLREDPYLLSTDVGIDSRGYSPVSWEQLKQEMEAKKAAREAGGQCPS